MTEEEVITERFEVHHYDGNTPVFVVQIEEGQQHNPEMIAWLEKVVQLSCRGLGMLEDQEVRLEYSTEETPEDQKNVYPY